MTHLAIFHSGIINFIKTNNELTLKAFGLAPLPKPLPRSESGELSGDDLGLLPSVGEFSPERVTRIFGTCPDQAEAGDDAARGLISGDRSPNPSMDTPRCELRGVTRARTRRKSGRGDGEVCRSNLSLCSAIVSLDDDRHRRRLLEEEKRKTGLCLMKLIGEKSKKFSQ